MILIFRTMHRHRAHTPQRARRSLGLALAAAILAALALTPAIAAAAFGPPLIENVHGWGNANDGQSTLQATIDPEGLETTYAISACEPSGPQCQQTEGTLPADSEDYPITLQLTGLQRGIAYQLGIHASSSAGETKWAGELILPTLTPNPCPSGECPPSPGPFPEGTAPTHIVEAPYLGAANEQLKKIVEQEAERRTKAKEAEEQKARELTARPASELEHTEEQLPAAHTPAEHPACRVPALKGDTLTAARRALAKAHCRLGAIHQPTHHHGALRVSAQGAPAGKQLAHNARVALTLGAKGNGAKRASRR